MHHNFGNVKGREGGRKQGRQGRGVRKGLREMKEEEGRVGEE